MQKLVIIDYGMGNINSVKKQLERLKVDVTVTSDPLEISKADKIILPGVGHFGKAMENLTSLNILSTLNEAVLEKRTPVLGICLGMQLMAKSSEEGNVNGLGWFDAEVIKIKVNDTLRYKIPHTGWNTIELVKNDPINNGLDANSSFYFVHAYKVKSNNDEDILHRTCYETDFTSAISKNDIFGVQYHPEKSQDVGLKLFKNFISL